MGRHGRSRRTETESSNSSESSDSSHRETTRRAKKIKYVRLEVLRSSRSSEISRRSPSPPPRKVKNIRVDISGTRSSAKRSGCSDRNSTHPPRKSKDVNAKVSGRKATKNAGSSARDCDSSSMSVNAEVSGRKATKSVGISARDSDSSPTGVSAAVSGRKATRSAGRSARDSGSSSTDVNVEVSGRKAAKNAGINARDSDSTPTVVNAAFSGRKATRSAGRSARDSGSSSTDVNVEVSGREATKSAGISARDSASSPTDVNAAVSGKKAANSEGISARDSASSPTDVNVEVSGREATKSAGISARDSASSLTDVNAAVSGKKAANSEGSSARDSASSPTDVKDVGTQFRGEKAAATAFTMASVKVSTPNVQINVQKPPPSLWSRLWSGLSKSKALHVSWRDGALQDPKAPVIDSSGLLVSSQESSLPEDEPTKQDSPALQKEGGSSKSSAESDVLYDSSETDTRQPAVKRRKIFTADSKDQFEAGCSRDEPQMTARQINVEGECQAHLFTPQTGAKSTAVARIAVNSYKQLKCRSYVVCKHLREATNDIGLIIFCSYPEDQTLCLSVYGLSFMIALTKHYVKNTKAIFRETLRCGAMVLNDDGRMAYSCKEVVTTLRRRLAEIDEASVITETYLRRSATVNQQAGYGVASSTKNITSHLLTADLKTSIEYPAQEVWKELLFSTACFENLWKCPFNKQSTYMGSFLSNWTNKVAVPVMRKTSVLPYSFYPDRQVDVVCLPYADDTVCMTLIVQRSPSSGGLSVLTPADVKGFIHGARNMLLTLHLPKFRVSTPLDVADLMNRIACVDSEERWMRFLHAELETSIAVDEGNWHVACTERSSSAGDPVAVIVDRPFHFVITDNTSDLILYVGRVMSLP